MNARVTEPKAGEATVVSMPRAEKSQQPKAEAPQSPARRSAGGSARRSGQEEGRQPPPDPDDRGAAGPGRRRRLFLAHRRPLRGHRQRLCAAGQGLAVAPISRAASPRSTSGKTSRSRPATCCSRIDPAALPDRARPGQRGARRRRASMSSSCRSAIRTAQAKLEADAADAGHPAAPPSTGRHRAGAARAWQLELGAR